MTSRRTASACAKLLADVGYEPHVAFNALQGKERQLFFDAENERQVDVFVGVFRMSHTIPLEERLELEPVTVPLAELLLTKLQIAELNQKDVGDSLALLHGQRRSGGRRRFGELGPHRPGPCRRLGALAHVHGEPGRQSRAPTRATSCPARSARASPAASTRWRSGSRPSRSRAPGSSARVSGSGSAGTRLPRRSPAAPDRLVAHSAHVLHNAQRAVGRQGTGDPRRLRRRASRSRRHRACNGVRPAQEHRLAPARHARAAGPRQARGGAVRPGAGACAPGRARRARPDARGRRARAARPTGRAHGRDRQSCRPRRRTGAQRPPGRRRALRRGHRLDGAGRAAPRDGERQGAPGLRRAGSCLAGSRR